MGETMRRWMAPVTIAGVFTLIGIVAGLAIAKHFHAEQLKLYQEGKDRHDAVAAINAMKEFCPYKDSNDFENRVKAYLKVLDEIRAAGEKVEGRPVYTKNCTFTVHKELVMEDPSPFGGTLR